MNRVTRNLRHHRRSDRSRGPSIGLCLVDAAFRERDHHDHEARDNGARANVGLCAFR